MTVLIVRYQVREDSVAEVEAAIDEAVAAVATEAPDVGYAMGKLPDGVTFVGVVALPDGADNPLPAIPAARELQRRLPEWVVGDPPVPQPLHLVATHGLFEEVSRSRGS